MTEQDGWIGKYCFSYDEHYDPANVSFGRMLACNEFVLQPGAGFGLHRHRGVDVVTVVLEGVLTHVTGRGQEQRGPGVHLLRTGDGVEHDERNDGSAPVRFVQAWLLPGEDPRPTVAELAAGEERALAAGDFLLAVAGEVALDDGAAEPVALQPGDSARLDSPGTVRGVTPARALVWSC